jgi:hypothetical protein
MYSSAFVEAFFSPPSAAEAAGDANALLQRGLGRAISSLDLVQFLFVPVCTVCTLIASWTNPARCVQVNFVGMSMCLLLKSININLVIWLERSIPGSDRPVWLHAVTCFCALLYACIGTYLLTANARQRGQTLVFAMRTWRNPTVDASGPLLLASVAPLLGFGTLGQRDPHELVHDARRVFAPTTLSGAMVRRAGAKLFGTFAEARRAMATAKRFSSERSPGATAVGDVQPLEDAARSPSQSVEMQSYPRVSSVSTTLGATQGHARRLSVESIRYTLSGAGTSFGRSWHGGQHGPRTAPVAEPELQAVSLYVVHGHADDASAKIAALAVYLTRYEERHKCLPSVWLDSLCTDLSLSASERLEHLPLYLARSQRLLVLAGPKLTNRLWNTIEIHTWFALGGRLEDIDVALIGPPGALADEAISALDAFHVMYTDAQEMDPTLRARLQHVVEIASISQFNSSVRQLVPLVRRLVASSAS